MVSTPKPPIPFSTAACLCVAVLALAGCPGDDVSLVTDSDASTSAATTDGGNACIPGQQVACACPGGLPGAQVCAPDGASLGPCDCPTDPSTGSTTEQADSTGNATAESTETTSDGSTTDGSTTDGSTTDGSTTDGSTTDGSTTDGSTTDGGGCNPACSEHEVCLGGTCECLPLPVVDSYHPCGELPCLPGSTCLVDVVVDPTVGVCAPALCADACECPAAPPGFAAECGDVLGTGEGYCHLPCPGGAPCPDGMTCMFDLCMWPIPGDCCTANTTPGCTDETCEGIVCLSDASCCDTQWDETCVSTAATLCPWVCTPPAEPQYDDCINGGPCPAGQSCIADAAATLGWCGTINCTSDAECQPPPPTGTAPAVCGPINATTDACLLDCSGGQTCPDGMTCFSGFACVWD